MIRAKIKNGKDYDKLSAKVPENMLEIYCDACADMGWIKEDAYMSNGRHFLSFRRKSNIVNKQTLNTLQKEFENCFEKIRRAENSIYSLPTVMATLMVGSGFAALWLSVITLSVPNVGLLLSLICITAAFMLWFFSWAGYLTYKNFRKEKAIPVITKAYKEAMEICKKAKTLTNC